MICPRCSVLYLVHSNSSGTDELCDIYLINQAIKSELLHQACRLRSARDTIASVAAPASAAAVDIAAAAAGVDADCLVYCASIEYSIATNVMFIVRVDYQVLCTNIIRMLLLSLL